MYDIRGGGTGVEHTVAAVGRPRPAVAATAREASLSFSQTYFVSGEWHDMDVLYTPV